jgi:hypothetical protein
MNRRILLICVVGLTLLTWVGTARGVDRVTHGAYASVLCKWMYREGAKQVGDGTDVPQSMKALSSVGIEPKASSWGAEWPMSDADIANVLKGMIKVTKAIKIPITPERGVDLVAATSIELGLSGRDVYLMALPMMGWTWSPYMPRGGKPPVGGPLPSVEEPPVEEPPVEVPPEELPPVEEEEEVISGSQ